MHPAATASRPRHRNTVIATLASMLPLALLAAMLVMTPGTAGAGEGFTNDLSVTMVDDPDPVAPGGVVTFSIRVTNLGPDDAANVTAEFFTDGAGLAVAPRLFNADAEDSCSSEGTFVSCDLGTIPAQNASVEAFDPELDANEKGIEIDVFAPETEPGGDFVALASFTFSSGVSVYSTDFDPVETNNSDSQVTTVTEGDSDSGVIGNNQSLSTVQGTQGNPVTTDDPFALQLTNKSGAPLQGSIAEEPCDGSQSDPLCSTPRLGGVLGNFQFQPATTTISVQGTAGPVVTIGKLFYDRTLARLRSGFKIFYQKQPGDPVVRLPRCDPLETECFRVKKLASGDQIVRVAFSTDPRITRG